MRDQGSGDPTNFEPEAFDQSRSFVTQPARNGQDGPPRSRLRKHGAKFHCAM
jgi:hypothetical protein